MKFWESLDVKNTKWEELRAKMTKKDQKEVKSRSWSEIRVELDKQEMKESRKEFEGRIPV